MDEWTHWTRQETGEGGACACAFPFSLCACHRPSSCCRVIDTTIVPGRQLKLGSRRNVRGFDTSGDGQIDSFDMNGDGLFEASDLHLGEFVHEYVGGGTYEVVISVTDPWSGSVTDAEQVFVLEPWLRAAPFADDHLEGEGS